MLSINNIRISFHHISKNKETECFLKILFDDSIAGEEYISSVKLYHKDIHDKDKARKYALRQAIKLTEFPKEDRQLIWQVYRDQKPGGRW